MTTATFRRQARGFLVAASLVVNSDLLLGQGANVGTVQGVVRADSSAELLQSVNVSLLRATDQLIITGTVTDRRGVFRIQNIPEGEYEIRYSLVGYVERKSARFTLDSRHRLFDAGQVFLSQTALDLTGVTVTSEKPTVSTAIDRKVYNVQQDLLSTTGSVSDLLQNIPSVQVDVDGTVSLRGSPNVQILINGKPSPLMAGGSADVLQQIPASSVERIEVITNPSAKFKPEGTGGLINIVMKKEADLGLNGTVGINGGNSSRYNINASGNYKAGAFNLFGTYSFRQDERNTWTSDVRQQLDTANQLNDYSQHGHAFARPYTHFLTLGAEYLPGEADKLGLSGTYRRRRYTSTDTTTYLLTDNNNAVSSNYNRMRIDYDQTPVGGGSASYQHDFLRDDHTVRLEFTYNHLFDEEDNHFTNVFSVPAGLITYDNRRIQEYNNKREITADYHWKSTEGSVLEAGYDGTFSDVDFPFTGSYFDATEGAFVADTGLVNHFTYRETIHAVYGTYERSFGTLSAMAGLRLESASINSDLITKGIQVPRTYFHVYPTLHLAYKLNEFNELQLNYSLRVDRPDAGDLNPFPEYQNPRNLRAGNPYLDPEFIHSIELGFQIQNDAVSIVPGIFYRNRYNGFTTVTQSLNDSTLLTTEANLSTDQSGGVELVVTGSPWSILALNWSANTFYEEIDASNLGYGSKKSTVSWNSSLNCNLHVTRGTLIQVNSNYRSSRLTPQGDVSPGFVLNIGLRQDLLGDKLSLVATVWDVFATFSRKTSVNTAWLFQNTDVYRDSRVVFIGLTYHFGAPPKRTEDKPMQYDDNG